MSESNLEDGWILSVCLSFVMFLSGWLGLREGFGFWHQSSLRRIGIFGGDVVVSLNDSCGFDSKCIVLFLVFGWLLVDITHALRPYRFYVSYIQPPSPTMHATIQKDAIAAGARA